MADFNKIYVKSGLSVQSVPSTTLGFNDGYFLSKAKYGLDNHMLTLNVNTTDNVSIFYNNGIANCYEFSMKLYKPNTSIPATDLSEKRVNNINSTYTLVFVNGELQPTSAYTIENSTTLTFVDPYTNDMNRFFDVAVYTSSAGISRVIYTDEEISNLSLDNIQLPSKYSAKNVAIFINGRKVSFLAVEVVKKEKEKDTIKLNIPNEKIESFEIITFMDSVTDSINFITESGYLTYGPYDDYSKKVPFLYDTIVTFNDQAKILVDNLRAGFIIKEEKGYGELIVVDDTFESPSVRCIAVQKFTGSSYTPSEYYLEVPEYTKITKYLAEFDNKYTFLPEILLVFQRMLLDELNDSIQRLRDMRCIQKVDSVNVNNLLRLLGFTANVKTLNVKQRRELLEELNEFYRIVGTRYSYNLVNILQNNLKLINMEQLFTPYGLQDKSKKTVYRYNTSIPLNGHGQNYSIGDYLKAAGGYITLRVTDVDENGAILNHGYEIVNSEGYVALSGDYDLEGGLEGYFNITSPTNKYTYEWSISGPNGQPSSGCHVGQILKASGTDYTLRVVSTEGDGCIDGTTHIEPNMDSTGSVDINDVVNRKLYPVTSNMDLYGRILSNDVTTDVNQYELVTRLTGGIGRTLNLPAGKYYVKMSGGGGAGSSSTEASPAGKSNGTPGEVIVRQFTLSADTDITYYVGQGGGGVYAKGTTTEAHQLGAGYEQGAMGQCYQSSQTGSNSIPVGNYTNPTIRTATTPAVRMPTISVGNIGHTISTPSTPSTSTIRNCYIGGQGGGSSAITVPAVDPITQQMYGSFIARGGNGGNAKTDVNGGVGGNGGVINGTGAAGSTSVQNGWSDNGQDGWIEIYRIRQNYTFELDQSCDTTYVPDGQEFNLDTGINGGSVYNDQTIQFTVIAHRSGDTINWELSLNNPPYTSPTQGNWVINTPYISMSAITEAEAYLTITSTPGEYVYQVQLEADYTLVRPGMTFTGVADGQSFVYVVKRVDNATGIIYADSVTPAYGPTPINAQYVPAIYLTGTGGKVSINSEPFSQKNVDRCYIDFYTRDELCDKSKGEGLISYYRADTIDYRTITEGTPNSPQFWVVGRPDLDYGSIANSLEVTSADYDYGWITDKVAGEWVEYWNWDRKSNWYPTNHVDLEMKIPVGVNITSYVQTFIEQFYDIASTVVFIHSIIESFYFGNEGNTDSNSGSIATENDGIIPTKVLADAKSTFGIATGAPITEQQLVVTSNPHIQYLTPNYYYGWSSGNARRGTRAGVDTCYVLFYTPTLKDDVYKKVESGNPQNPVTKFVYDGQITAIDYITDPKTQQKTPSRIYYTNTEGVTSAAFTRAKAEDTPLEARSSLTLIATPADSTITISSVFGLEEKRATGTLTYGPYENEGTNNEKAINRGTQIRWSVTHADEVEMVTPTLKKTTKYLDRGAVKTLTKASETKYIILDKVVTYETVEAKAPLER